MCPGNHVTGGKAKRTHTRKVVNWAATAFRLAAQSVGRTQTALGAFYRRMRARLGAPKAITATAHKIARIFYKMWSSRGSYDDPGAYYYEQRYHQRLLDNLKRRAASLGFDLVQQPSSQEVS